MSGGVNGLDPFELAKQQVNGWSDARKKGIYLLLGVGGTTAGPNNLDVIMDFARYVLDPSGTLQAEVEWHSMSIPTYTALVTRTDANRYRISLDTHLIQAKRSLNSYNLDLVFARTLLHEVGHLALHPDAKLRAACSPEQEDHAWRYAFAVVGLAVGHLARLGGRAWMYV